MRTNISPGELINNLRLINDAQIGVCSHTDDVTPNDIYIALGEGVRYSRLALDKGALAVIYQVGSKVPDVLYRQENVYEVDDLNDFIEGVLSEVYGKDIADVDLIGITGTNGKTSCAHFSCQLFNLLEEKSGYIGTLGYGVIGEELSASRNTTPDRITLYRYIALLNRMGCHKVVMEVSSHGIALGRIAGLDFVVGAFTNLSRDHLDFHLTMQAYEETKLSFFTDYSVNKLVVNSDDVAGGNLIRGWSKDSTGELSSYGKADANRDEYYQYSFNEADRDACIEVRYQDSKYELRVNIKGQYNIENLMAAVLICCASGYSLKQIEAITALVKPVPGRLECSRMPNGLNVCVDYAHTPAGMQGVLTDMSLQPDVSSATWCVFGCGGKRDRGKRHMMGEVASVNSDYIVITDDNTRGERAETILCDIVDGIDNKSGLTVCRDRGQAIAHVLESADSDDLVLVLGKGDELMMDYGLNKVPHRDIDVVSHGVMSL